MLSAEFFDGLRALGIVIPSSVGAPEAKARHSTEFDRQWEALNARPQFVPAAPDVDPSMERQGESADRFMGALTHTARPNDGQSYTDWDYMRSLLAGADNDVAGSRGMERASAKRRRTEIKRAWREFRYPRAACERAIVRAREEERSRVLARRATRCTLSAMAESVGVTLTDVQLNTLLHHVA